MKRRQWTAKQKLEIVLNGLRGDGTIAELCNRHQITQNQYYNWRDRLLNDGERVFERGGVDKHVERLEGENRRLKGIIGDLTVELKKRLVKRTRTMNEANQALLARIRQLKAEHPAWGYRRVWAYLRHREGLIVNHKRVYRLMRENGLLVPRKRTLRANRTPMRGKPRTIEPNRIWGTDMTKILLPTGWVYLHVVLDWGSKKLIGCTLSQRSRTEDWLDALHQAVNSQFPDGIREAARPPSLVSDNGSQPTSEAYARACRELRIGQIFASYNNPKGNADTERVMRTIKEDLIWPREYDSFSELETALAEWVHWYNHDYPHSALGWATPYEYETWFNAATRAA